MRSWIRYALAAVLTAVLGAGAHARTPSDTLVMAFNIDDIISLDPAEVFELVGGEVIANIYDRITMHEPENLEALVGGVAESWEVSADGKTITLKVRPGQKFHSGNPVTADDGVLADPRGKAQKTPVFLLNQSG
ncbi:MAG: hypothetical protein H6982_05950 [Chromatiales bacterium]|nr:hypothetical protein [Chromatiales bacterium]